jgi:hypothetical protein
MNFTQWFILIMVSFTLLMDIFLAGFFGLENTISRTLLVLAKQYPIIPFALGVIAGHIFWLNC